MVACIAFLFITVLGAVHHAEVIAERVGEPFGALVLALAVTVIEVSIIVSLMLTSGADTATLARDTVFAAVMIILTGMVGLTLLIGALRFKEQQFPTTGVMPVLTVLVTISVLTLILPDFTTSVPGPYLSDAQLLFVAVVTLVLYGTFLFVQNFRHRADFVPAGELEATHEKPSRKATWMAAALLPANLLAVVLLAEGLAPDLDRLIDTLGAPPALSGILIACVILLPEGISAVKAAKEDRMQRSLNLSLGSALASICLTVPTVAFVSYGLGLPLALGISAVSIVLFVLALLVVVLVLGQGRTNILQGTLLLVLFAVYLFITLFP
jgi:Ca2+:H+ antiporter